MNDAPDPQLVNLAASDLDARGSAFGGIVRQAARFIAEIVGEDDDEPEGPRCAACGWPFEMNRVGRPRLHCYDPRCLYYSRRGHWPRERPGKDGKTKG